jgi:L-rhamnose mutarotase
MYMAGYGSMWVNPLKLFTNIAFITLSGLHGTDHNLAALAFFYRKGKTMIKGFKMKLYEGQEAEYIKRHNELWPEMQDMIHQHGGKNYTIFLDRDTDTLFGYIEIEDETLWIKGADTAVNRKWWDFMADIMETNEDNSPVSTELIKVFHLE